MGGCEERGRGREGRIRTGSTLARLQRKRGVEVAGRALVLDARVRGGLERLGRAHAGEVRAVSPRFPLVSTRHSSLKVREEEERERTHKLEHPALVAALTEQSIMHCEIPAVLVGAAPALLLLESCARAVAARETRRTSFVADSIFACVLAGCVGKCRV